MFGHPVKWCWFNISIQYCSTLLNSRCLTCLATLLNDVGSTFPFNTVQHCWIQDVERVCPPYRMILIQLFVCWICFVTLFNIGQQSVFSNAECWFRFTKALSTVSKVTTYHLGGRATVFPSPCRWSSVLTFCFNFFHSRTRQSWPERVEAEADSVFAGSICWSSTSWVS